jgi:hypothetical protein
VQIAVEFEERVHIALAPPEAHAALERLVLDELAAGAQTPELIERLKGLRSDEQPARAIIESVLSSRLGWHTPEQLTRWRELDRFAAWLMQFVRDEAIETADFDADSDARIEAEIPGIVDEVLFRLVHHAENGSDLGWRQEDGTWVSFDDLGGGEMGGWLGTDEEDGWRARFSRQRWIDV